MSFRVRHALEIGSFATLAAIALAAGCGGSSSPGTAFGENGPPEDGTSSGGASSGGGSASGGGSSIGASSSG